jgi:hypothetical protein
MGVARIKERKHTMTDNIYTYSQNRDGTFDTFDIRSPDGRVIASLYF